MYINREKGWFRVRYRLPRAEDWQYECFKIKPPGVEEPTSKKGHHSKWGS